MGRPFRSPTLSSPRACRPLLNGKKLRARAARVSANRKQEQWEQGACHDDKHDDHCRATGVIEEISSSAVHVLGFLLLFYNAPGRSRFLQWQGLLPKRPTAAALIAGESRTCVVPLNCQKDSPALIKYNK